MIFLVSQKFFFSFTVSIKRNIQARDEKEDKLKHIFCVFVERWSRSQSQGETRRKIRNLCDQNGKSIKANFILFC